MAGARRVAQNKHFLSLLEWSEAGGVQEGEGERARKGTRGGDRETRGEERKKVRRFFQRKHTHTHTNVHVHMHADTHTHMRV